MCVYMCVRVYVCACVKTSENSNVCISGITRLIGLESVIDAKPKCSFLSIISVKIDSWIEISWSS